MREKEVDARSTGVAGTAMKKLMICLLILAFFSPGIMARGRQSEGDAVTAEQFVSLLQSQLTLSEAEMDEIREIVETDCEERKEIMAAFKGAERGSREALMAELQALQERTEESVAPVLTDEQMMGFRALYVQKFNAFPQKAGRTKGSRS